MQRISAGIDTFPAYSGDPGWWTNWHYLVFRKKLSTKEIWIDGQLFLSGDSSNPLPTDFTEAWIGLDPADNAGLEGIIDDFAVFGTSLDSATISSLVSGTLPTALPATVKLLAYWNFNDPPSPPVTVAPPLAVAYQAGKMVISWSSGTLVSSPTVKGTYAPVSGASSPFSVTPVSGRDIFFIRSRNKGRSAQSWMRRPSPGGASCE